MGRPPKEKPAESAPVESTPEPAADAKPAKKHEPDFDDPSGRFNYESNPRCKGRGLKWVDATYTDSDGRDYPAKLVPLPVTKGAIVEGPGCSPAEFNAELQRIAHLPFEKQFEANAELQKRMGSKCKAMPINGQLLRLAEYKGHLLRTLARQVGDGPGAYMENVPCADLYVNFSDDPIADRWVTIPNALPEEYAGRPALGHRAIPHFKLS